MSATIKAAITALKGRIAAAYSAISAKGGTLPATQDSDNLASAIATIPSGGGGISLSGYNYSDPSSIEGIGQAIWAWDKGKEVTEIVDDYTDMNIDNSSGAYENCDLRLIFPNLQRLTFEKSGVLNTKNSRIFLRQNTFQYLSLPFTEILDSSASAGVIANCSSLTTLKFPKLEKITGSVYSLLISNCPALVNLEIPLLVGATNSYGGIIVKSCAALETLNLPNLSNFRIYSGDGIANTCAGLKYVNIPKLGYIYFNNSDAIFKSCANLIDITFGKLTSLRTTGISNVDLPNLEKFEVGQDTQVLPSLARWTAANVADDTLLNTNIATYLAGRLYDYTGGTAHSITISTALYNRLTQATKDIFTNKNWTIVTA